MVSKKQLKLLRYLYKRPRTIAWIKRKFKVNSLRDVCSGIFTLIKINGGEFNDSAIVSLSQAGIIEVESHQWLNSEYILSHVFIPIIESVISFVSLRFCFPMISSIGYCQNIQYLQGYVGSAHTRPLE